MIRLIPLLIFTLTAITPLRAAPLHETSAEKGGVRFRYSSELDRHDNVTLRGVYLDNGDRFTLVMDRHGHVSGTVGFQPVNFSVDPSKRDKIVASLKNQPAGVAEATGQ